MPVDIQPSLQVEQSGPAAVVQAFVRAGEPRPLDWRLTVETAGGGGSSRIAQSGRTDGRGDRPVAIVRVDNPGQAVLQIFVSGELVAQTRRVLPGRE